MACRYYTAGEEEAMQVAALNRATRLLCKMVAHFGIIPGDPELKAWKDEHDEMDRRRLVAQKEEEARKEKEARRIEARNKALAKLTPEERKALGYK